MLRHGSNVTNAWEHTGGRNLGMSLSLYPNGWPLRSGAVSWR